jgi:hypothetical protein
MNVTTEHLAQTSGTNPTPPGTGEDGQQWRMLGRGSGVARGRPCVGVEIVFNRDHSEWLAAESERTGLDYVELIRKLVDNARNRGAVAVPEASPVHPDELGEGAHSSAQS